MVFTRSALLTEENEVKLAEEMVTLWKLGKTATQISTDLQFGAFGTPYAKLNKLSVYTYKEKFNKGLGDNGTYFHLERFKDKFSKRIGGIKKGEKRYKNKPTEPISFKEFENTLNKTIPKVDYKEKDWFSNYVCRKRAYLILLFWTPLRKSEIYERVAKNFIVEGNTLKIDLYRKKKFYNKNADTEPFYLLLDFPYVSEVVEYISHSDAQERPFDFGSDTAWRYPKEVFGLFPHAFRFFWITNAIETSDDPKTLIEELLGDTGLDIRTVVNYILDNPKHKNSISKRMLKMIQGET